MLTLTPTAAEAVRTLVASMEVDDDIRGLRISSGEATDQGGTLELALVKGPEATDDEIESAGARVYLEPAVTEILDGKLLDASVESGRVRFILLDRGSSDSRIGGGPSAA